MEGARHTEERILYYPAKKNWWSRAGVPEKMPAGEPGGPDSEVFFDFGTEHDPALARSATLTATVGGSWRLGTRSLCNI